DDGYLWLQPVVDGQLLPDAPQALLAAGKQAPVPLLLEFVKQKGDEWIVVLMIQLLSNLAHLHKEGWIFGDLKPDNLIVSGPP
ncbi:hypothetical protein R0K05_23690, partial [Planococcus sp. SIMBA_160]